MAYAASPASVARAQTQVPAPLLPDSTAPAPNTQSSLQPRQNVIPDNYAPDGYNDVPADVSNNAEGGTFSTLPPDGGMMQPQQQYMQQQYSQQPMQQPAAQPAPAPQPAAVPLFNGQNTGQQASAQQMNAQTVSPVPAMPPQLPGMAPAPDTPLTPEFFSNSDAPGFDLGSAPGFDLNQTRSELEEETRRQAFDAALQGLLPLRPGEIRELLEHFDRTQESVELPVYPSPKPEVAVETISLDPGAKPVTVKSSYGNVTTLNIVDSSGAPWPIQDVSWAGNFEIVGGGSGDGSHIIRISPQSEFAFGNMSIRLIGLQTPVILSLESSRDTVHYRFDAIIPQYGPLAEAPLIDNGLTIQAGDLNISSVLQGIAPEKSERLNVAGTDGRTSAYRFDGMTYLRTPLTLLSPAWTSSVASADGMRVYAIQDTPVVLLSDKGKMVRAHLSDREELFDE